MPKKVLLRDKVAGIKKGVEYPDWLDKEARPYFDYLKELIASAGNNVKVYSPALGILAEDFALRQRMKDEIKAAPCVGTIAASPTNPAAMGKRGSPTLRAFQDMNGAIVQLLKEFYLTPRSLNAAYDRNKGCTEELDPFAAFTNPEDLNKFVEVSSEITQ